MSYTQDTIRKYTYFSLFSLSKAVKGGAVFGISGVIPSVAFERVLLCHRPHRAYGHLLNTEFSQRLVGCAGDVAKPSRLLGSTPCSGTQMPVRNFPAAPPFTSWNCIPRAETLPIPLLYIVRNSPCRGWAQFIF
ncbi:MAG: hypothetical protein NC453_29840 [Muribaculum sp.]|nr:hypothetical protein [Muribaculum sp.]